MTNSAMTSNTNNTNNNKVTFKCMFKDCEYDCDIYKHTQIEKHIGNCAYAPKNAINCTICNTTHEDAITFATHYIDEHQPKRRRTNNVEIQDKTIEKDEDDEDDELKIPPEYQYLINTDNNDSELVDSKESDMMNEVNNITKHNIISPTAGRIFGSNFSRLLIEHVLNQSHALINQ